MPCPPNREWHGIRTRGRGFTLIELLVSVVVVALLASIAVPVGELVARRGKEQELRLALREIRSAIDRYKRAYDEGRIAHTLLASGYPPSLTVLVDGVVDARDPSGKSVLYFLRRVPADPFAPAGSDHAQDSWGMRSYASAPDAPSPGEDVFDIYSRSPDAGLNGVPYRLW